VARGQDGICVDVLLCCDPKVQYVLDPEAILDGVRDRSGHMDLSGTTDPRFKTE